MKFSSALLLLTSAVLGVGPSSAQGEPNYFEVGTTLTLEPDVSAVPQPITTIRWKYGTNLVVDWIPSCSVYYGSFKGRTTFVPETMRLVINRLTLADSGQFSLETNRGIHVTYEVKVIKPPPKPLVLTTKNPEGAHALRCTADTKDLGPVSYEWKREEWEEDKWEEGPWTKGEELKGMNSSDTPEKFSCRLKTHVRTGEASDPVRNPIAQGEPKYFEVGTTLTLEPDVSTVKKPINSIRWKYGTALVVDWDPSSLTYYGSFKRRTTLDPQTLLLVINRLTLAESGQFSLETNLGTVGTHEVKVIKPPPKPLVLTTKNPEGAHALRCTADTQDLGPVSYEWKKDEMKEGNWEEGPWTKGEELRGMNSSDTPEKFSCRLKTRVRTGEASDPVRNPTGRL